MRVFDLNNKEMDPDKSDLFEEYLTVLVYAIRSVYHQTHGHSSA